MVEYWTNNDLFDDLVKKYDNKFLAVQKIAELGRAVCEKYNDNILHSEGLVCAVTGKKPRCSSNPQYFKKYEDRILDFCKDYITYINDKYVKDSIVCSMELSITHNYLIYSYSPELQDSYKSKVRVVCNMLWDIIKTNFY